MPTMPNPPPNQAEDRSPRDDGCRGQDDSDLHGSGRDFVVGISRQHTISLRFGDPGTRR